MKEVTPKIQEYSNEFEDDFAPSSKLKSKKLPSNYVYANKGFFYRFLSFNFYYFLAMPVTWLIAKIMRGFKVKNRKVLKKVRKTGYFLYGNHTSSFDPIVFMLVNGFRRPNIISGRELVNTKIIAPLVKMLGAIPLPDSAYHRRNFDSCLQYRAIEQKRPIIVFPEAHIWEYATKIRTLRPSTFRFPVDLNLPIITATTTWRKPRLFFKKTRMTITLSEPIYPHKKLTKFQNYEYMCEEVRKVMVDITSNSNNYEYIRYVPHVSSK